MKDFKHHLKVKRATIDELRLQIFYKRLMGSNELEEGVTHKDPFLCAFCNLYVSLIKRISSAHDIYLSASLFLLSDQQTFSSRLDALFFTGIVLLSL